MSMLMALCSLEIGIVMRYVSIVGYIPEQPWKRGCERQEAAEDSQLDV